MTDDAAKMGMEAEKADDTTTMVIQEAEKVEEAGEGQGNTSPVEEEMNLALKESLRRPRLQRALCGTGDSTENEKSYLDAALTSQRSGGNKRHEGRGGGCLRGSHC